MAKKRLETIAKMLCNLPASDLVGCINICAGTLRSRGLEIRDFNSKGRTLHSVAVIGNKVYLLTKGEQQGDESGSQ